MCSALRYTFVLHPATPAQLLQGVALRKLDLGHCLNLAGPQKDLADFFTILKFVGPNLRSLCLAGCKELRELSALSTYCPHLEFLDLFGCDNLSPAALRGVRCGILKSQ